MGMTEKQNLGHDHYRMVIDQVRAEVGYIKPIIKFRNKYVTHLTKQAKQIRDRRHTLLASGFSEGDIQMAISTFISERDYFELNDLDLFIDQLEAKGPAPWV